MKNQTTADPYMLQNTITTFSLNADKLLASVVDVICAIDAAGIFRFASASSNQLFGYAPEEMTGMSFLSFIHPDDIENTLNIIDERTHNSGTSLFENRYYKKDGTLITIHWSGRWDENDQLLYCVARDGSVNQQIEHRLLKAQEMAKVASYEFDVINRCYTHVSETYYEIFGLDKIQHGPFTSELFWKLVHPDDVDAVQKDVWQTEQRQYTTKEFRIIRPDGQIVYINRFRELIYDADGTPIKTIGTLQDITERKLGELAIQKSEELFRFLVQNGNNMLGITDCEGNYRFASENVEEQLGFSPNELVGKSAFQFIHPDDAGWVRSMLQTIESNDTLTLAPFRFQNKQGEWRWLESTISNHLEDRAIAGLIINSRDITEKKLKDDALQLNEQRFKALVENGSDLIVIIDEKASFTYISDNTLRILGYTPEELVGQSVIGYIHPDDQEKVALEIYNALFKNEMRNVQHRFLHKSGRWVWLESIGHNHVKDHNIQGILVNSRNIDDRVELQNRLDQEMVNKQREITAAVIKAQETERSQLGLELHDNVNQVLTTVKLYNEMYLTGVVNDRALLLKSNNYIQDCINEIRSISKRLSAPTLGHILLQDSIQELINSINLTNRLEILYYSEDIDNCGVSDDLHLAIYRIIQESLNNIIKYSQARQAHIDIRKRKGELHVTITDNGKGFDTSSKRMGIGLTNMKTRAENLNGRFNLTSKPHQGCTIEIVFPYVEEESE
ncbi:MAG TPA: PAS domain S-box protein [Flavisolibacter sp.]|nr:PAS domain S-box protein [Flavisolibacter sp.]